MQAADVLMFNRSLTAQEALSCGLVSQVVASSDFGRVGMARLQEISKLPKEVS